MQRNESKCLEESDEIPSNRSRPTSRRNSCSSALSRKNSAKKESSRKCVQKASPPNSCHSTPKKVAQKTEKPDFIVTGKQILKKYDRANSLPGAYHRRPSNESLNSKAKRSVDSTKRTAIASNVSQSSKSRETSLEDDMSLDLSQISDFEDTNSKYGLKQKFAGATTSTPKVTPHSGHKSRSGSLQSQRFSPKLADTKKKSQQSLDSSKISSLTFSRDSYKTSSAASNYRYGRSTEPDYSSMSPEYSGQSSTELSPRATYRHDQTSTPSCCTSWMDSSELDKTQVDPPKKADNGEWNNFWANYNNSVSRVPMKSYYDQCPTPYRTENIDLADLDFSAEGSRKRSPDIRNINSIIRNEGLQLTPRETQNIIKCAHILGNVLTKAIDRSSKHLDLNEDKIQEVSRLPEPKILDHDPEVELKKKALKLELKEQNTPLKVQEERKCETVTTQTDISLPNTKSAPRIFEKILRQLSKSSIDESILEKQRSEQKEKKNEEGDKSEEVKEVKEEES